MRRGAIPTNADRAAGWGKSDLRWSDIDLERGTLTIEQSHVEVEGKEHAVDEPKTERSRRTLPLPEDVATALRELRTRQKRERLALGKPWSDDTHVCSMADGEPVLPRTFTGWFHRIRIAAELPRITLRNLRHTSAPRQRPGVHGGRVARARRPHDHRRLQPGVRRRLDRRRSGHVRRDRESRLNRPPGRCSPVRWHTLGTLAINKKRTGINTGPDLRE